MKKIILIVSTVVLAAVFVLNWQGDESHNVIVGGKNFAAIVAHTPALREKGLSGMPGLGKDQVMLFIFEKLGIHGFWMKDMLFPIDILWVDSDFRVVSFEKNVATSTYPTVFYPKAPSLYVVEFKAGTLDILGVKEGDVIDLSSGK